MIALTKKGFPGMGGGFLLHARATSGGAPCAQSLRNGLLSVYSVSKRDVCSLSQLIATRVDALVNEVVACV